MDEKINFQNDLDFNVEHLVEKQRQETKELLDVWNKILMPKVDKISEWHDLSDDKYLIPDVLREVLLGWYISNPGLASNWINKEYNSID